MLERLYKHLKKHAAVKSPEESKRHTHLLEDHHSGHKMKQELRKTFSGVLMVRPGSKLIKITELKSDEIVPVASLPVISETVGLPYTFDFEFMVQLYHTYFQSKELALDELAQFKAHEMAQIISAMQA